MVLCLLNNRWNNVAHLIMKVERENGGLRVLNFLAKYNKKVLILEKHSIPAGLVTSFSRKGVHFDLGIHGLYELEEEQAIPNNYIVFICQVNIKCLHRFCIRIRKWLRSEGT